MSARSEEKKGIIIDRGNRGRPCMMYVNKSIRTRGEDVRSANMTTTTTEMNLTLFRK